MKNRNRGWRSSNNKGVLTLLYWKSSSHNQVIRHLLKAGIKYLNYRYFIPAFNKCLINWLWLGLSQKGSQDTFIVTMSWVDTQSRVVNLSKQWVPGRPFDHKPDVGHVGGEERVSSVLDGWWGKGTRGKVGWVPAVVELNFMESKETEHYEIV